MSYITQHVAQQCLSITIQLSPLHMNLQVANSKMWLCLCMLAIVVLTTVLFKVLYYKIKIVSFIFCVSFFMYYLFEKH